MIERIKTIVQINAKSHAGNNNQANDDGLIFVEGDIRNEALLTKIFNNYPISSVIHFAGLKAVSESVDQPLNYFHNNVYGTLCLCNAMQQANVKTLVFSSSATVYGEDTPVPYIETMAMGNTTNPYGTSKAMVEKILADQCVADSQWSVTQLRYFNPIGAHNSGLIGEDPKGVPNNLVPYISQVAIGQRDELSVFGGDYPTPDGTGIQDYIHVIDLAKGHLKALTKIQSGENKEMHKGEYIWNLGTGQGYSVLEVMKAFEHASGKNIPYKIKPRRNGDLPAFWADASKAKRELNWSAELTLQDMVSDSWRWQLNNPNGYN